MIFVYSDERAGSLARLTLESLRRNVLLSHYPIHYINSDTILNAPWEKKATLLVMPGGRDKIYQEALQGAGNHRIASFVQNGGKYLGICAGGYYGAASIEFSKETPAAICEDRELCFFPGKAIGPAFNDSPFCYHTYEGVKAALVEWEERGHVYYHGGCYFEAPERHSNTKVLAKYIELEGAPAAIVQCSFGKGTAILTGVHPEISFSLQGSIPFCSEKEAHRSHLYNYLLKILLD